MKPFIICLYLCFFSTASFCQTAKTNVPNANKPIQVAEVSCGKCKLSMAGSDCELAVRIQGKTYYADGANIDNFGDAHAHDGMCNAIRKAEVQGKVVNQRFKITYIKLLPVEKGAD